MQQEANSTSDEPQLIRGVGTVGATALNMIDMIGVGPFITMPLIIAAMGGPQAMLGWIFGALLVICDGLVWSELGASMPKSGGPYNYLKEIYGDRVGLSRVRTLRDLCVSGARRHSVFARFSPRYSDTRGSKCQRRSIERYICRYRHLPRVCVPALPKDHRH